EVEALRNVYKEALPAVRAISGRVDDGDWTTERLGRDRGDRALRLRALNGCEGVVGHSLRPVEDHLLGGGEVASLELDRRASLGSMGVEAGRAWIGGAADVREPGAARRCGSGSGLLLELRGRREGGPAAAGEGGLGRGGHHGGERDDQRVCGCRPAPSSVPRPNVALPRD